MTYVLTFNTTVAGNTNPTWYETRTVFNSQFVSTSTNNKICW